MSIEFIGDVNLRRASACIARSAPIIVLAEALVRHEDLGIGAFSSFGSGPLSDTINHGRRPGQLARQFIAGRACAKSRAAAPTKHYEGTRR